MGGIGLGVGRVWGRLARVEQELSKGRRWWRNPVVVGSIIGVAIVVGIPVMMSIPALMHGRQRERRAGDIGALLREEMGITLPADTEIVHAQELKAGKDAAGVWEVRIPTAGVAGFAGQLASAGKTKGWKVNEGGAMAPVVPDAPGWWTPEEAGVSRWVSVRDGDSGVSYYFGYTPTSGRCFLYWLTI